MDEQSYFEMTPLEISYVITALSRIINAEQCRYDHGGTLGLRLERYLQIRTKFQAYHEASCSALERNDAANDI